MKKKLLSLVLAGAMVASTSVSAFADTDTVNRETTTIEEGEISKDINIGITGNVLDNKGNKVPGTINVTVPTATTFSVDATTGELISPDMTITNNSDEKIKVIASKFEDPNGEEKINIITKTKFEESNKTVQDVDRGTIWLRLKGGSQNLGFTSESNDSGYGKMYDTNYTNEQTAASGYVIGEVGNQKPLTLKLEGKGGVKSIDSKPNTKAIQDDFKLVLKISRVQ